MLRLVLSALGGGMLGAVAVPIATFFGSLALFHLLVPQCGEPGDSGGCAMSAGVIGFASTIPGFLIGMTLGVVRARKRADRTVSGSGQVARPTSTGGVPDALSDAIRGWAAGTSDVQRVWLLASRAGGRHGGHSSVELAVEVYGWDSPDPRDRLQAHGSWVYDGAKWREQLTGAWPALIRLRPLSIDDEDEALRAIPAEASLLYERES